LDEALIVVPFDRHERVYPWGPHLVREYAARHVPGAAVGLLDLAADAPLRRRLEWKRFPTIAEVFAAVRARIPESASRDSWMPGPFYVPLLDGTESSYVAGTLLLADERFLRELAALGGRPARVDDLVREHAQFVQTVHDRLRVLVSERVGDDRPLLGVSHFGRILTSSLAIVHSLRRLYPRSSIVLGGSQITPDLAADLVATDAGMDAAVVGFGERPFAALLAEHRAHGRIDGARVPFVVTRTAADVPGHDGEHHYRFESAEPLADAEYDSAKVDANHVLHVLPIRGCRWGVCTFCADAFALRRFRAPVLAAPEAKLARDLDRAIREWVTSGARVGRLSIDAAEVYGDEAIQVLTHVDRGLRALGHRFPDGVQVFFYIPSRKFDVEIARRFREFSASSWHRFRIAPTVAIESLNEVSLRQIRKGIDPLQAIASLKAALDMGWDPVQAQFFLFYPGEEAAAVRDEVTLMWRSLHVLAARALRFNLVKLPVVSKEGELFNEPERYGLRARSVSDPLLSLRFGKPIVPGGTIHASQYRLDDGDPRSHDAASWFDLATAWHWTLFRLEAARGEASRARRWGVSAAWGAWALAKTVRAALHAALVDRSMVERTLLAWWCSKNGSNWHKRHPDRERAHARCAIVGQRLEIDFPFPFPRRTRRLLAEDELALLRAAYFPRTLASLETELAGRLEARAVRALVEVHERLGSIVRRGESVVCLANDPENLETAEPAKRTTLRAPSRPAAIASVG
jgi:hypothetical protein